MQTEHSKLAELGIIAPDSVPPAPPKIRGFLIVAAIGLIISLIKNLEALAWAILPFRGETWEILTTPGFEAYDPNWKPALLFGVISASVTLLLSVIGLVLFFRKHRFFPTFIIVVIPINFLLVLAGYYLESLVSAIAESELHTKGKHQLILRFIALHIWIPYFVVSDRVKRTFVR